MTTRTDQQIIEAKAIALEKFGSNALEQIEVDAPIGASVLAAPFDRKGWASYVDALHRDPVTAHGQVFAERVVDRTFAELNELRSQWPALPGLLAARLAVAAGDTAEHAVVRRLDRRAPPAGMAQKDADALLAAHQGAALWSVELPAVELSCVLKAPLADTYLAASTADRDARGKGSGVIGAMEPYILEAVVWSSPAIEVTLERRPAVIGDLRRAYLRMGGEGAAVRSKRI